MKKIKYYFALYAAKSAQGILKLLGRNATYFPGKVAIRLCKDFLRYVKPPKTVIAVTGTNGKTTVSNLVTSILKENGYTVTNNSFGSNIAAGVISALIEDMDLLGRPKKDIAVLEVDERSSLLIYPLLQPDFLICNNIMRDSIKRNAHTEFISYIITSALEGTSTKLVQNADDMIAARLGNAEQPHIYFGIDAEKPVVAVKPHLRDIVYCPECGALLKDEYVRYNHIGRHYCDNCGLKSPAPNYTVTNIDRENSTFTVSYNGNDEVYTLINDNIVNIYNFCGAIALLHEFGLDYEQIKKGFTNSKIVKTRLDEAKSGDLNITMIMAKGQNPIACSRCYDYVSKYASDKKAALLIVDDVEDNICQSETTCWLYDCDYSVFSDPGIKQVIFAGPRCHDHYLRALLAGVDAEKIQITEDSSMVVSMLDTNICKDIFVLHELYRPGEAKAIKEELIARGKESC